MAFKIWRRSDEPSELENYLLSELAAAGFSREDLTKAQANKTNLLGELTQSKDRVTSLIAAVGACGFKEADLANAETFRAALADRIEERASEQAVRIAASSGGRPVKQSASESLEQPQQLSGIDRVKAEFRKQQAK